MRLTIVAGAAAALALAGCATTQPPQVTEGKAVAGLWASLQAASEAADTAVKAGVLKGQAAATVAQDLQTATTLISAANAAYHANPATDTTTTALQATALISQVLCIVQPTAPCATAANATPAP